MALKQIPMVFAGSTSGAMAASLTGDWFHRTSPRCGGFLKWTGTPTGAITFELSYNGADVCRTLAASDFSPALTEPAGGASITDFSLTSDAPYIRPKYTATSGTGTLTGGFNSMEA